jgi:hypothetical protein
MGGGVARPTDWKPPHEHGCLEPSKSSAVFDMVRLISSSGERYTPRAVQGEWVIRLPPGTYHAIGAYCFQPGPQAIVVKPGGIVNNVVVGGGCTIK